MTKTQLFSLYKERLHAEYLWAKDATRLNKYLDSFWQTITTEANTWNNDSFVLQAIWREQKLKGKPTYKALRALPL
jgi:hypothetical protein